MKRLLALLCMASVASAQSYYEKTLYAGTSSASTGSSLAIATGKSGTIITRSNSGSAMTDTLPSAVTARSGWNVTVQNTDTTATDTITPSAGNIAGGAAFALLPGQSVHITSDGTNYQTLIGVPSVTGPETVTTLTASGLISTTNAVSAVSGNFSNGFSANGVITLNDGANYNTKINTGNSTGVTTIGNTTLAGNTSSSIVLAAPLSFTGGTNYTGTNWGQTSPVFNFPHVTMNDTATSGTIDNDTAFTIQGQAFSSTGGASTTITTVGTLYVGPASCTGGVVCTNIYALMSGGKLYSNGLIYGASGLTTVGGEVNLNASGTDLVRIGNTLSTISLAAPIVGSIDINEGNATSQASWGTTSPVFDIRATVLNDTTASGTVTADYAHTINAPSFTSTGGASTTITTAGNLYVAAPTCTGGVVCTNKYAIATNGAIGSTIATGTAPFTVASTTNVANLNASLLNGTTFAAPAAIGSGTPAGGAFTTLSASSTVSGTGFSTYLASPPAIGGSAAAAINGTAITGTSFVHGVTTVCNVHSASPTNKTGAGTGTESNIAVCTVPAGLLGTQGSLRVIATWNRSATTTNTETYAVRVAASSGAVSGGALITSVTNAVSGNTNGKTIGVMDNTDATHQQFPASSGSASGFATAAFGTSNVDTGSAIYVNFNCANTTSTSDTCGLYGYTVEALVP